MSLLTTSRDDGVGGPVISTRSVEGTVCIAMARQNQSLSSFNDKVVQLRRYRRSERHLGFPITCVSPFVSLLFLFSHSSSNTLVSHRILFQSVLIRSRNSRKSSLECPGDGGASKSGNVSRAKFTFVFVRSIYDS